MPSFRTTRASHFKFRWVDTPQDTTLYFQILSVIQAED